MSLTRRRRIFSRDLFRDRMSLTLYRLCRERLSAGLLGLPSDLQTEGTFDDPFLRSFYVLTKNVKTQSFHILGVLPNAACKRSPLTINMKM